MNPPSAESPSDAAAARHELRTSLNQILGYSEMLLEEAQSQNQPRWAEDVRKIHAAATRLLDFSRGAPASPGAAHAPLPVRPVAVSTGGEHGHLLVVDDDPSNGELLARRLQSQGHTVTIAENGRKALEYVRQGAFDLILLDIMMPEMDGYQVLQHLKEDKELRHIPVIMVTALDEIESVARCIEIGAEDYLPKPFNPVLLRARVGACLEKKHLRDQEQFYYQALLANQKQLVAELAEAARYVKSLLPPPIRGGPRADWRFLPSVHLGGDSLGFHWLGEDQLAIYLVDVEGHGVGAALLSVSVLNVLRSQSLPDTDFRKPGDVLSALNERFPKANHNGMGFTLWYGVYDRSLRQLTCASGGHPPALLLSGPSADQLRLETLDVTGPALGAMPKVSYRSISRPIEAFGRLHLFSSGACAMAAKDTSPSLEEALRKLPSLTPARGVSDLDRITRRLQELNGSLAFEDDVSLLEIIFDP
jgi:sigma-B regulation protein RsbU (phosphoserine phosphatase)